LYLATASPRAGPGYLTEKLRSSDRSFFRFIGARATASAAERAARLGLTLATIFNYNHSYRKHIDLLGIKKVIVEGGSCELTRIRETMENMN
jgi:hypothetical protein